MGGRRTPGGGERGETAAPRSEHGGRLRPPRDGGLKSSPCAGLPVTGGVQLASEESEPMSGDAGRWSFGGAGGE